MAHELTEGGAARKLRERLGSDGIIVSPIVWDGLGARVAESLGFECLGLGGYALGAHLVTSEPLLTLSELAAATRYITTATKLPLVVDAGAGYGEPLHVMRTVRELERAGAAAVHIEDQIFPKRVHYHQGIEHVVPRNEILQKIRAAVAARQNADFVIMGRTDAMRTDGFAEGVERANLFLEAGADMVMIFPNDVDEARMAPRAIGGPICYVNSEGNRLGRPVLAVSELEDFGYKMVSYSTTLVCAAVAEMTRVLRRLKTDGVSGLPAEAMLPLRKEVESLVGLDELYRIEAETSETGAGRN
ncbi:MAG: hypothetical protein GEU28_05980 [Dehalococcoidia bacterium]|nr:hypothetical protein [Dehalococcoidia bacterium]